MARAVGWSDTNKVTRTTLRCAWYPCAMVRVSGRETLSGTVSVAVFAREGAYLPPEMT